MDIKNNNIIHGDSNPLVSVIMPAYNVSKFITETLNSLMAQTYVNWELIVVDDCSTDNTAEIIQSYNDNRIYYIKNDVNSGVAQTRNRALREARGKYVAFLDSDDVWKNNKLEKQVAFMQNNNYHFSATHYEEIDSESKLTNILVTAPKKIGKLKMLKYSWIGCLTVMYDRDAIGLVEMPAIKIYEDYATWLQIVKKAKCYVLNENLAMYRRARSGSMSNISFKKRINSLYTNFRVAQKMNPISSAFFTIGNLFFGAIKKLFYVRKIKR